VEKAKACHRKIFFFGCRKSGALMMFLTILAFTVLKYHRTGLATIVIHPAIYQN